MDLRLLQYFIAVAELEHVGKAAERLHISQSPLSRQIRQLEKELNLELFVREKQRIRLTESGRWLLQQAQGLVSHVDRFRSEAEQRSRGQIGTLTIAFTSAAMWNRLLPKALRQFQIAFPAVTVDLQALRSAAQYQAVRSGRIDIGFVSAPPLDAGVEHTCVSEEPSKLVIPAGHSLAGKRRITPRDLQGVRWILFAESLSPERQQRFFLACAKAGFTPKVVQKVSEPISLLALIESGVGVGLIRSSARNYAPRSLVFQTLPWFPLNHRTYMIRQKEARQPWADAFAAYLPKIEAQP